jgi:hypothetical protein
MMRNRILVAAAVAGATLLVPVPAQANHSWGGYHWARTSNPFTVKLGNNVTSQAWNSSLSTASTDWSKSTVLDTAIVAGGTNPKNCRGTTGRVEVCNSTYGNTGWLGVASISITGGTHITKGTVKLNDTYFNTPTYNTTAWRNLVTCQEIGHTFGLAHQDENFNNANLGTCMDYTNDPSTNQHPNAHDYEELVTIYSHLDSTTTVGAALPGASGAAGAAGGAGADSAGWGRAVEGSRASGHSTYVRDLGRGNLVITFVTWAR